MYFEYSDYNTVQIESLLRVPTALTRANMVVAENALKGLTVQSDAILSNYDASTVFNPDGLQRDLLSAFNNAVNSSVILQRLKNTSNLSKELMTRVYSQPEFLTWVLLSLGLTPKAFKNITGISVTPVDLGDTIYLPDILDNKAFVVDFNRFVVNYGSFVTTDI